MHKINYKTRQPGAAAEARLISGAQGWEGVGVRGQSPPPPRWGWPGCGNWSCGFGGCVLVGTAALLLRMWMCVAVSVLRVGGWLTRGILTVECEVLWKRIATLISCSGGLYLG